MHNACTAVRGRQAEYRCCQEQTGGACEGACISRSRPISCLTDSPICHILTGQERPTRLHALWLLSRAHREAPGGQRARGPLVAAAGLQLQALDLRQNLGPHIVKSTRAVPKSCLLPCLTPPLQNESRSEAMFGQIIERKFKDEVAEKMMGMIDE